MSMGLMDRLTRNPAPDDGDASHEAPVGKESVAPKTAEIEQDRDSKRFIQSLKTDVHNQLFEQLDLSKLSKVSEGQMRLDITNAVRRTLDAESHPLTTEERECIVKEVQDEVFGFGPLEPLLQDPTVSDILVNGPDSIFVERRGRLEATAARFQNSEHLMRIIEKIVSAVGRRVDEMNPMVDARLEDGSRVNAIVPPLALDGPSLSIRRFAVDPLGAEDLVEIGTMTHQIVELLEAIVGSRLNVLISGGTGSGKTTLLNVVSGFIPENERIVTIEDSAELQLKQDHVVRLETRPESIEGKGKVGQRELVINSLRMRPDRIVIGEVRGGEAFDMLQAMNTGHDGSLTTVHANSPRDALSRIENMVAMAGLDIPQRAIRQQIASAIDVVIQLSRLSDGSRRLLSLQEVSGMEGEVVTMQELFTYRRDGLDADGNVVGTLHATGIRPRFVDRLKHHGFKLSADLFEPIVER
jgi:pilus assembly protein CpaF